jgi:hypothetical protein
VVPADQGFGPCYPAGHGVDLGLDHEEALFTEKPPFQGLFIWRSRSEPKSIRSSKKGIRFLPVSFAE